MERAADTQEFKVRRAFATCLWKCHPIGIFLTSKLETCRRWTANQKNTLPKFGPARFSCLCFTLKRPSSATTSWLCNPAIQTTLRRSEGVLWHVRWLFEHYYPNYEQSAPKLASPCSALPQRRSQREAMGPLDDLELSRRTAAGVWTLLETPAFLFPLFTCRLRY